MTPQNGSLEAAAEGTPFPQPTGHTDVVNRCGLTGKDDTALDESSRQKWVSACWADMRRRQAAGQPFAAEEYLPARPGRESGVDASLGNLVVDVVYGEYGLRRAAGEPVSREEFVQRFPDYAEALRRQFAFEDVLSSDQHDADETASHPSSHRVEVAEPPERIGKYVIVALLASGGQATVYRALHPDLKVEVVLKVPHRNANDSQPCREDLTAEARTLAGLNHPHLARVFDLDVHEGVPYLVSEYIPGRTLEQFAADQSPSPRDAALLVAKIARGLAAAHRRGVVHLDVKPRNIVVDERGEPRLIDFGLAIRRDAIDETRLDAGTLRGTLQFMPPEQAQGNQALIGPRSDIFALGGVLFYLLTGQTPYGPGTWVEILTRAQRGEWRRDLLAEKQIPHDFRTICERAMDVAVERRFATADELAMEFERCARPAVRSRRAFLVGGGCAAVITALAAKRFLFPATPPVATPVVSEPLLSIEVWDDGRYLRLADVAPVKNGDRLRIEAEIPRDYHASLFLLTSEGKWKLLAHVAPNDATTSRLRFPPEDNKAAPLSGPSGTEVVVLCGRPGSPISLADLSAATADVKPWPVLPDMTVLRADSRGVSVLQRSRDFGPAVNAPDGEGLVRERLRALHNAMENRFPCFEAIAFYHE